MNLLETGQRVRQRRIELGLSQGRLAKLSGLSRSTVNQLETGSLEDLRVAKLACCWSCLGCAWTRGDAHGTSARQVPATRRA